VTKLFPHSHEILATLLYKFHLKINASFQAKLAECNLDSLIHLYTLTNDFVKSLFFLNNFSSDCMSRQSYLSYFDFFSSLVLSKRTVLETVYLPYRSFQLNYESLQRSFFDQELNAFLPVCHFVFCNCCVCMFVCLVGFFFFFFFFFFFYLYFYFYFYFIFFLVLLKYYKFNKF
jgi:hypothetical protein